MRKRAFAQLEYRLPARCIAGTRAEKLEQIDDAIQELLEIKFLECAADGEDVQFIAAPRRSHWFAMTVTVLAMLIVLVLLLGTRTAHAEEGLASWPVPEHLNGPL